MASGEHLLLDLHSGYREEALSYKKKKKNSLAVDFSIGCTTGVGLGAMTNRLFGSV